MILDIFLPELCFRNFQVVMAELDVEKGIGVDISESSKSTDSSGC